MNDIELIKSLINKQEKNLLYAYARTDTKAIKAIKERIELYKEILEKIS